MSDFQDDINQFSEEEKFRDLSDYRKNELIKSIF
jgi:hypothetical protein